MFELIILLIVLAYFIGIDSSFIRIRIEWALAMVGVNYKPSKAIGFIVSAMAFYVVYVLIFDR